MTFSEYLLAAKKINPHEKINKKILLYLVKQDSSWLYVNLNEKVSTPFLEQYLNLVKKYKDGYPVQYIIGYEWFYNHKFIVDERVLIPRNETEELISCIFTYAQENFPNQKIKILDLGTGSGCIAISLALAKPHWIITASDISYLALEVAKLNINNYQLNNIKLIQSDLFANINEKFNIIICNPPYIDQNSATYSKANLKYEPDIALFALNQGLQIYEAVFKKCLNFVENDFLLAFEIGFDQKNPLEKMVKKYFKNYSYHFKKDFNNNWRMLFISSKL